VHRAANGSPWGTAGLQLLEFGGCIHKRLIKHLEAFTQAWDRQISRANTYALAAKGDAGNYYGMSGVTRSVQIHTQTVRARAGGATSERGR